MILAVIKRTKKRTGFGFHFLAMLFSSWIPLPHNYPSEATLQKYNSPTHINIYGTRSNYSTTKKIISDVYLKAPHEFQRKYKNFYKHVEHKLTERDKLLYLKQQLRGTEDIRRLEEAIHFYEETEFPQSYNDLLQWRLIVKYSMLELETIDLKYIRSLTDIFWSGLFSHHLQIKEYENMPEAMIRAWERQLPKTCKIYRREFRKLEYRFYSDVYKSTNCIDENARKAYNDCLKPMLE